MWIIFLYVNKYEIDSMVLIFIILFLFNLSIILKIGIKKAPVGAILKGKIYVLQLKKQALACKKMVGVKGFEPSASWSQTTRATKLRHTPMS